MEDDQTFIDIDEKFQFKRLSCCTASPSSSTESSIGD